MKIEGQPYSIGLVTRGDKTPEKSNVFTLAKSNIQGGFKDLKFDLEHLAANPPDFSKPTNRRAENYKRIRASQKKNLLIIYLLDYQIGELEEHIPTVGFYLEIQRLRNDTPVPYATRLGQENDLPDEEFFESDETDNDEL